MNLTFEVLVLGEYRVRITRRDGEAVMVETWGPAPHYAYTCAKDIADELVP